jgi:hypothetical protein
MHVKDSEPVIDMFARKSETMLGSAGHRTGGILSRNDNNQVKRPVSHSSTITPYIMLTSRLGTTLGRLRGVINSSTIQIRRNMATARPTASSKIAIGLTGLGTIAGLVSRTILLELIARYTYIIGNLYISTHQRPKSITSSFRATMPRKAILRVKRDISVCKKSDNII